jgi:hypothetical protein
MALSNNKFLRHLFILGYICVGHICVLALVSHLATDSHGSTVYLIPLIDM